MQRDAALLHAHQFIEEGVDILDIGGESSRPGANPISVDEELDRIMPVIEGLREFRFHFQWIPANLK